MLAIVKPLPIAALGVTSGAASAANMLTASPREVWRSGLASFHRVDIDLGAATSIDSFYLGGGLIPSDTIVRLYTATGMGAGLITVADYDFILPGAPGPRYQTMQIRAAPIVSRYFSVSFRWSTPSAAMELGVLALGLSFRKAYDYSSGRLPIDLSRRSEFIDGGFGIDPAAMKSGFRWRFVDLDATAREAMWDIAADRGQSRPVVVAEDISAPPLRDRLVHYGLFDKLEAWERANAVDTELVALNDGVALMSAIGRRSAASGKPTKRSINANGAV